jgi:hypothetical protein
MTVILTDPIDQEECTNGEYRGGLKVDACGVLAENHLVTKLLERSLKAVLKDKGD